MSLTWRVKATELLIFMHLIWCVDPDSFLTNFYPIFFCTHQAHLKLHQCVIFFFAFLDFSPRTRLLNHRGLYIAMNSSEQICKIYLTVRASKSLFFLRLTFSSLNSFVILRQRWLKGAKRSIVIKLMRFLSGFYFSNTS